MGCASTPPRTSTTSTTATSTSSPRSPEPRARPRRTPRRHHRGERAAGCSPAALAGGRRLRYGRHVERRFPSRRHGRADRPQEAYYLDYHGNPQDQPAAKYGSSTRTSAYDGEEAARDADLRAAAGGLRQLPAEPRPDRQFRPRPTVHKQTSPGKLRAMTAYTLLLPGTPMLFMGQEFAASAPFLYFADHPPDLADTVDAGRKESSSSSAAWRRPEMQDAMARPESVTFQRCGSGQARSPRRDGLAPPICCASAARIPCSGGSSAMALTEPVSGPGCFVLRYFGDGEDRLMLVNLEVDLSIRRRALLAPPPSATWSPVWSSEDPVYGGSGTPTIYSADNWLPGAACVVSTAIGRSSSQGGPESRNHPR